MPDGEFWRVVRTVDAGHRWSDVTPVGADTSGGLDLSAISSDVAAVAFRPVGYRRGATFAVTVDAGSRWTVGALPGAAAGPSSMAVVGSDRILAVLADGRVARSLDGGRRWLQVDLSVGAGRGCTPRTVWSDPGGASWVGAACAGRAGLWSSSGDRTIWRFVRLPVAVPAGSTSISTTPTGTSPGVSTTLTRLAHGWSVAVLVQARRGWRRVGAVTLPLGRSLVATAVPSVWAASLGADSGPARLAVSRDEGLGWRVRSIRIGSTDVVTLGVASGGVGLLLGDRHHQPRVWICRLRRACRAVAVAVAPRRPPSYGDA